MILQELETKVSQCADSFSTNKATNAAYKNIFWLIFRENIVNKNNNDYGFAEISCEVFKKLSKRKYKDILVHLSNNNLIFTSIPLSHTRTGRNEQGICFTRGYKVDRSFTADNSAWEHFHFCSHANNISSENVPMQTENVPMQISSANISAGKSSNSLYNSSILYSNINIINALNASNTLNPSNALNAIIPIDHFLSMHGNIFEGEKYDVKKIYQYINIDKEKINYPEGSEEWNHLVAIWNKHTEAYKNGNRIFSWFHNLHGDERSFFTLNESTLREAFDVPACNFCILAKLLENTTVDKTELSAFQNLVRHDYIYKRIAENADLEFTDLVKKEIKKSCQHWLNIRKRYAHTGAWKDKYFNYIEDYFKTNYPTIYETLLNWREETYTNSVGKTKVSKMLWQDFQEVEFDIISNKICNYLYETYGVYPVTVHDALYLSDDDLEKVTESIEDIFWHLIDFKYLNYNPNINADNIFNDIDIDDNFISEFVKNIDEEMEKERQESERKTLARNKLRKIKFTNDLSKEEIDKLLNM